MPKGAIHHRRNCIDNDLRQRIIKSVMDLGNTPAQTAKNFSLPRGTVYGILQRFEEDGTMEKKRSELARPPLKMTKEMDVWARQQLDGHPELTLTELADMVNSEFNTNISSKTVCNHLNKGAKKDRYCLKVMRYEPEDFNSDARLCARKSWCEAYLMHGGNIMDDVHIDECGFNLRLVKRLGRACNGVRPRQVRPTQRGRNVTLIIAVSRADGIVASRMQMGGTVNADFFRNFMIEDILPALEGRHLNIIMDNAPVHNGVELDELCEEAGHRLWCLPKYTPYLNCAEWVFGSVKPYVKKQDIDKDTLQGHVMDGVVRLTREMIGGWMREVQRNFTIALRGERLGRMFDNRSYRSLAQFEGIDLDDVETATNVHNHQLVFGMGAV
ncbi:DDE superfamily endonuclease-domain-containing protein [Powellomyces hirtus]|nr:DDE superfamily endonuclease-domain-containing protein [Powellomyces hirtus]